MINDANVKAVVVEQVLALTQVFNILQWKNVVDLTKWLIHDPHRQENVSSVHVRLGLSSRATLSKAFFFTLRAITLLDLKVISGLC